MAKVIYFDAEPTKKGVIRFVEDYRRGGFLRKEKIQYGIAGGYLPVVDEAQGIYVKIVRDYPNALIYYGTVADIERRLETKRFWLIGKDTGRGFDVYYSREYTGIDFTIANIPKFNKETGDFDWFIDTDEGRIKKNGKKTIGWTSNISNAEIQFDEQAAISMVNLLRRAGEKAVVVPVYMNFDNPLLCKNFIILCKSKKSGVTKYFARHEEGNRIRLVKNSYSAARFTYAEAVGMFESLKGSNKAFFYTVCPAFRDNVNFTGIEDYMASGKVAKAIAVSDKLKWMNR